MGVGGGCGWGVVWLGGLCCAFGGGVLNFLLRSPTGRLVPVSRGRSCSTLRACARSPSRHRRAPTALFAAGVVGTAEVGGLLPGTMAETGRAPSPAQRSRAGHRHPWTPSPPAGGCPTSGATTSDAGLGTPSPSDVREQARPKPQPPAGGFAGPVTLSLPGVREQGRPPQPVRRLRTRPFRPMGVQGAEPLGGVEGAEPLGMGRVGAAGAREKGGGRRRQGPAVRPGRDTVGP